MKKFMGLPPSCVGDEEMVRFAELAADTPLEIELMKRLGEAIGLDDYMSKEDIKREGQSMFEGLTRGELLDAADSLSNQVDDLSQEVDDLHGEIEELKGSKEEEMQELKDACDEKLKQADDEVKARTHLMMASLSRETGKPLPKFMAFVSWNAKDEDTEPVHVMTFQEEDSARRLGY